MIDDSKILHHVRERLYDRRQALLSDIDVMEHECKEWLNPHDFQSGWYTGNINTMKSEVEFLEKLINDLENAYFA